MRLLNLILLTAVILGASVSTASAAEWSVGEEKELSPGTYVKLLSEENGWRVWQQETKNGKRCNAVKSGVGIPTPNPISTIEYFFGNGPAIKMSHSKSTQISDTYSYGYNGPKIELMGRHLKTTTAEFRSPGDRFYTDLKSSGDDGEASKEIILNDGKIIEVNVVTYEYHEIFVGRDEKMGRIDLTGVQKAYEAVKTCGSS